jgi:ribonuclease HI
VNIYTDSKYAFAPLHVHGARYKERGQLMAGGKEIKNKEETLQLLEAVWELSQVAIIHYRGYSSRGNRLAAQAAKRAAKELSARANRQTSAGSRVTSHPVLHQGGRTKGKR